MKDFANNLTVATVLAAAFMLAPGGSTAANVDGRSPAAMLASTFSDELAVHTNGKAKIFGVSVKDRGNVAQGRWHFPTYAGHRP